MKKHVALTALSLAVSAFAPLRAGAQLMPAPVRPQIVVNATGIVSRPPDNASISIQIVTNDDNATVSSSKNNDIYNAIRSKLGGIGIPASALHTQGLNVQFVPPAPHGLAPEARQPRYGYVTSRDFTVDVSPIENVGKAIDAANSAGATSIGNVSFGLKDRHAAYSAALAAAVADAKVQAQALAAAAGVRLGRPFFMSTNGSPGIMPMPRMAMMAAKPASTPTEVEPGGPVDVTASVTVHFAMQ